MAEATHIEVEAGVRYWEDACVNGINEDNDSPTVPLRKGDTWCPRIRLADGVIEGWPQGVTADVHYKVCDAGLYWLTDEAGKRLARWNGYYVPNYFLCPIKSGYGDYIIMTIGADGQIEGWREPHVDDSDWISLDEGAPSNG